MGRVLAIDFGEQRIGIALSDPSRTIAGRLTTLRRGAAAEEMTALHAIVQEQDVDLVVVGMPIGMGGQGGVQAELTRRWVVGLRQVLPTPVEVLDERLTTVQAHHTLDALGVKRRQHRQHVDEMAATLLLQSYLDRSRASAPEGAPPPSPPDNGGTFG